MKIDVQKVTDILSEVGATEIMPRFRHLLDGDIQTKSDSSLVTIADQMAEQALIKRLQAYLPGSLILGEESYEADPGIIAVMDSDAPVWVIDPIDGTSSFTRGEPTFGILLALMLRGVVLAAWIHDPNSGETLAAEKGAGAYWQNTKLALNTHAADAVGLLGSRVKKAIKELPVLPDEMPPMEYGICSAFDYPRMLNLPHPFGGRVAKPARFIAYHYTSPWDHLPGTFIISESGGYSANWRGQPYDYRQFKSGLFVCESRDYAATLLGRFAGLIGALEG